MAVLSDIPGSGGDQTSLQFRRRATDFHHGLDTFGQTTVQCQHGCRKDLARFFPCEFLRAQFPTLLASNSQTINVRFQPIVEIGEICQGVVRLANGMIPQQPKDGGFFRMLGKHGMNQRQSVSFPGKCRQLETIVRRRSERQRLDEHFWIGAGFTLRLRPYR